ncbi:uncharacterized protein BDR25DRAFT_341228 [Lindgomyces ingoldianus]|uniref:Uncharacterized protein n=1 Tax=Lindgomyces ingoldianus TaxID=673940 RepID=A0ACB6R2I2_9PLEO|nr:uncharacterized protein BDR25DRAFT_341228 [Lindgomyces ingoldianus]KAF2473033.1 hypothetical protein BDR25DRAFT_341228 [Lindgomyces ingoldianus]
MVEPLLNICPEKINSIPIGDDDMTWHDPPSSPFVSHIEMDDQENIPPANTAPTPVKAGLSLDDDVPQSAFKISSPSKAFGLKDRTSPVKKSPTKHMVDEHDDPTLRHNAEDRSSPKKVSPVMPVMIERPESAMSERSRTSRSPSKPSRTNSVESVPHLSNSLHGPHLNNSPPSKHDPFHAAPTLRDNEGLTVAMTIMEETRSVTHESSTTHHSDNVFFDDNEDDFGHMVEDFDGNPDGPDMTSLTIDDTCFSAFSEMPNLDMTKFAVIRNSPTKNGLADQSTPRARTQMTPSTARRTERTPSPTPRRSQKENDTTNLLLDFTAQFEAFSSTRRSPIRGRTSPVKSGTEPNLLSYIQNQRSPAKGSSFVPSTPSRERQHMLNLLDFELPPPPTPRSIPTVTIRELESLKSTFQSQISSLTASLSGKEAEVESLVKAVSNAERRVGEAQELVRDERSAREHAEAQMTDWKKKGEEVQKLLQDVQSELARNDSERESLISRITEAEKRAEDAETRASELETRVISAESKNVDMTTFIGDDDRKVYSEAECSAAIAEKVNEVARDLHTAYKAKHEKKIKALKDNYQKKTDERCKELRVQIIRLERQVEEADKKRDDTFSKVLPAVLKTPGSESCEKCGKSDADAPIPPKATVTSAEDSKLLETQQSEIQNLKAKLAGLQSELSSIRKSHDALFQELEAERVEKGELVAAAEQMLAMCGEKMEEIQQEEFRKSQMGSAPTPTPTHTQIASATRAVGGIANGNGGSRPGSALAMGRPGSAMGERLGAMGAEKASGIAKPSGLRAPGGFGYQSGAQGMSRSTSGSKSRIMSNIERMGGASRQQQQQQQQQQQE